MSIALLLFGCLILYGRSRFFPEYVAPSIGVLIKKNKQVALIIGYLLLSFSYILFSYHYGWGTGFVIYLAAISFFYCILLVIIPLHKRYVYVIAILCILLIIFENYIS